MRMLDLSDWKFKQDYHIYLDRSLSFWPSYSHYIGYMFSAFGFFTGLAMSFLPLVMKAQGIEKVSMPYVASCFAIGFCASFLIFPTLEK